MYIENNLISYACFYIIKQIFYYIKKLSKFIKSYNFIDFNNSSGVNFFIEFDMGFLPYLL